MKFLNSLKKYIVQILMCILVVGLAIVFKQKPIKVIPCVISLFVYFLDSKVNRFAKLIGAFNCIIYAVGFFIDGLYGSVGSALLYSMPIQLVTFAMWSKNKYKQGTYLHLLNKEWRVICFNFAMFVTFFYILIFNSVEGSAYTILQGVQFAVGLISALLIMFGYIEGMAINLINILLSIYLYFDYVVKGQVNQITYLVMNIYSLVYVIIGLVNWIKMYKEQKNIADNVSLKRENF